MGVAAPTQGTARRQLLLSYGYMLLWIALSATVIMLNKYILDPHMGGFPFPLTLTCIHMAFCSAIAWSMVKSGLVSEQPVALDLYLRSIVPIAGLFAVVLWMGNAAYLYLSVSFIQILKASMPMLVYTVGCMFGTEKPKWATAGNMAVVVIGVGVASFGELHFVTIGVVLQLCSIVFEAVRLALVQILLQGTGVKLNPITTMCHISPACFAFLSVACIWWEVPRLLQCGFTISPWVLLASALCAFCLNVSVFLLIGKTSALTMNVAGVIKDWMLIGLSVLLYASPITRTQLGGYGVAFLGVCWYNYARLHGAQAPQEQKVKDVGPGVVKLNQGAEFQSLQHNKGPAHQLLLREKLELLPGSNVSSPRIGVGRVSNSD